MNDELGKLKDYYHAIMEIDSNLIGDVVSRPRLYFIGVLRTLNRLNLLFPLNSKMCDPINKSHDAVQEGRGPEITSNAKLQKTLDNISAKAKRNCDPLTPWHELLLDDFAADQEAPIKRRRQTKLDLRYEKLGLAFD